MREGMTERERERKSIKNIPNVDISMEGDSTNVQPIIRFLYQKVFITEVKCIFYEVNSSQFLNFGGTS